MLTISPAATAAIRVLSLADVPERSGLRLYHDERSAAVAVVDRPAPGDDVIVAGEEDARVAVFVDPASAHLVDDQVLDARMDATPAFCLKPRRAAADCVSRPVELRVLRDTV